MRVIVSIPLVVLLGALLTASGASMATGHDSGVDLSGTDHTGNVFDRDGYDGDGYDRDGNDRNGFDRAGYKDASSNDADNNNAGDAVGSGAGTGINAPDGARLLAAQCFQCHGTAGASLSKIKSLSGESEAEIVEDMLEMKYSTNLNDIMHRQAMGYSEDQIRMIAAYFGGLSKGVNGGNDDDND